MTSEDYLSKNYTSDARELVFPILSSLVPSKTDVSTLMLFLPIKPQAKQSVRFSNGRGAYTDPQKKVYVNNLVAKMHPYASSFKFSSPVIVSVVFCFSWRKSDKFGISEAGISNYMYMSQRPDLDNLTKPVFDALSQSGILSDDGVICLQASMKVRCAFEGIAIKIVDLVNRISN